MANHKGPIPEWLNTDYIQTILKNYNKTTDLTVSNLTISPGSNEGDNYSCQIYRIQATISSNGKTDQHSFIGKYKRQTAIVESYSGLLDPFEMETYFFEQIYPKLKPEALEYIPKVYHIDRERQIILMEDLKEQGFGMQPRGEMLNKQQTEQILKALATFHGSTYLVNQENPALKDKTSVMWGEKNVPDVVRGLYYNTQKMLDLELENYGLEEKYVKVLRGFLDGLENQWFKVCELQENHINTILHGDSWMNNILHKFTKNGTSAVKLLDFQTIGYSSFAQDLTYLLFSSVQADVLTDHLDELLEGYYNKLRQVAPEIADLSLERVKREFAERYYFGYCTALCIRAFIYSEVPPDLEGMLRGETLVLGFKSPKFAEDLKKLLPFFEKVGII